MNKLKDYWEVTLDYEDKWHCFHRYHFETPYEATHLAPLWVARWIIPAPTRGQALTIAKRAWRQSKAESIHRLKLIPSP